MGGERTFVVPEIIFMVQLTRSEGFPFDKALKVNIYFSEDFV